MPKYNVYIIGVPSNDDEERGAVSLIGENMTGKQADVRVMTGLGRIDTDHYFVGKYEVGSYHDLKCAEELKNNSTR